MADIEKEISRKVDAFVAEMSELLRRAALAKAAAILSEQAAAAAPAATATPERARATAAAPVSAKPVGRRSPRQIAATVAKLKAYIAAHPGQRIEEIAKGLGVASKHLKRPVKKMVTAGEIRREGQRRATRYYPADSGGSTAKAAAGGRAGRKVAKRKGRGKTATSGKKTAASGKKTKRKK